MTGKSKVHAFRVYTLFLHATHTHVLYMHTKELNFTHVCIYICIYCTHTCRLSVHTCFFVSDTGVATQKALLMKGQSCALRSKLWKPLFFACSLFTPNKGRANARVPQPKACANLAEDTCVAVFALCFFPPRPEDLGTAGKPTFLEFGKHKKTGHKKRRPKFGLGA